MNFAFPAQAGAPAFGSFGTAAGAPLAFPSAAPAAFPTFGGAQPAASSAFPSVSFGGAAPAFGTFGGGTSFGAQFGGAQQQQQQQQFQLQQQQQQQFQQAYGAPGAPVPASLQWFIDFQRLRNSYEPASDAFRFRYFFYNVADAKEVSSFKRDNFSVDPLHRQAVENNPDPKRLVPVECKGPVEITRRCEAQNNECQMHREVIADVEAMLVSLRSQRSQHKLRIASILEQNRTLRLRLIHIMGLLDRGEAQAMPVSLNEQLMRQRLENMSRELSHPAKFAARLAEVQTGRDGDNMADDFDDILHETIDVRSVDEMYKVLCQQKDALEHLVSVVDKATRDLGIIRQATQHDVAGSGSGGGGGGGGAQQSQQQHQQQLRHHAQYR